MYELSSFKCCNSKVLIYDSLIKYFQLKLVTILTLVIYLFVSFVHLLLKGRLKIYKKGSENYLEMKCERIIVHEKALSVGEKSENLQYFQIIMKKYI